MVAANSNDLVAAQPAETPATYMTDPPPWRCISKN
jgi:hypothetical protein